MNFPQTVTLQGILDKVRHVSYTRLPESTSTICRMELANGYATIGHSACVDPANYNQAMGEKLAYNDALDKVWALEGYLLAERMHQKAQSPCVLTPFSPCICDAGTFGCKVDHPGVAA